MHSMGYGFDETVAGIITVAWIKWKPKVHFLRGIFRQNIFLGRIFFQFLTSSKHLLFMNEIIYLHTNNMQYIFKKGLNFYFTRLQP